ncbi:UDP-N-acetylenolpyruvoylglucosamine reductase [Psittacicella melopsittaci]|uniref:UDP-N-acetylenolpyruvoylglucosamine reductase n=1 Tax=Psittacicella melopsittaci TaxID=2028576 RepID=A0A3A1YAA7_9GAMM|nr:UDP-N-acetylmuramate dehydrogenase [Psittacicella melopsittaci]RIY33057.1 UDP-N-acetylenolpyruvoylglucosamine reductase [Psittacicella melopsittaci]
MTNILETDNINLTTFRVPVKATSISEARWPNEFIRAYQRTQENQQELVILGQGSNTLFVDDFNGEIVVNKYTGISLTCNKDNYILTVNSGVTIDELIQYCHRFKIYGLENLASIPSSIGTAAIGNIGAYGVEFEKFVDHVIVLDLNTGEKFTLNHQQLEFSYRHSILKTKYQRGYVVLTVVLHIPRKYTPVLTYAPLNKLDPETVTAKEVLDLVVETRKSKLPDYNQQGNGGSFFVNPIVSTSEYENLKNEFNVPGIILNDQQVKLSAGWLIEHVGLKGYTQGNAQVSPKHALVLINANKALGQEIARLASYVRTEVWKKFGVNLVPEIRFISHSGEVNATEYLQKLV